jgi:hypothetical protein
MPVFEMNQKVDITYVVRSYRKSDGGVCNEIHSTGISKIEKAVEVCEDRNKYRPGNIWIVQAHYELTPLKVRKDPCDGKC